MNKILLVLSMAGSLVSAKIAPSFSADLLGGGKFSLQEGLKKKKPILISFWATWCAPCLEELKHVQEMINTEKDLGLNVVTINVDTNETSTDLKPTIKLYKFTFPVVMDPSHEVFQKYKSEKSLPFSVLVAPSGEIEASFQGYDEKMVSKIKAVVQKSSSR